MTRCEDVYRHFFGYIGRSWTALRLSWVVLSSLVSRLLSLSLSLSPPLSVSLSLFLSLPPRLVTWHRWCKTEMSRGLVVTWVRWCKAESNLLRLCLLLLFPAVFF